MDKLRLLAPFLALWMSAAPTALATTTENLLINAGGEKGDLTGWSTDFGAPRVDDGTFNDGLSPHVGKISFLGGVGEYAALSQKVSLINSSITRVQIDEGNFYAQVSFWALGLDQGDRSDSVRLALVFRDVDGAIINAFGSPQIDSHTGWSNFRASVQIPQGARTLDYIMEFVRQQGSDLDAYFDDNSLVITDSPTAPRVTVPMFAIPATIRDFHGLGDFENDDASGQPVLSELLDFNAKPTFIGEPGAGGIASAASFDLFYNDAPDVNLSKKTDLILAEAPDEPGVFVYRREEFFPIDDQLFGNEDRDHNYHFTLEAHTTFTFHGGEFIELTSDDDGWLFINGRLALDLGGIHSATTGRIELNTFGLRLGQTCSFDLFYAERHTSGATLVLKTNAKLGGPSLGQFSDGEWNANYVQLVDSVEAEYLARVGDIDNLGFGWPTDFDLFSGDTAPSHDYPWEPDPSDAPGTDRIEVVSSYKPDAGADSDGYTDSTQRPSNLPEPITIDFSFNDAIRAATLQMYVDDFQAPKFGDRFQVKLNGVRAPFLEEIINSLDQTGPVGKLISVPLPADYLQLLGKGRLVVSIDDPTSGVGDGFAIDFVRLLINPKTPVKLCAINGIILDDASVGVSGAEVVAGEKTTVTDEEGRFIFNDIPAGLQHVTVRKNNFVTTEANVDVTAGKIAEPAIFLSALIDSDGDGLTDQDELAIYHTNPNNRDTDGDGMLDGDEVRAGTDPNSAATALRATSVSTVPADGAFGLGVQAVAGHVYQLQRWNSDNFSQPGDPAWIEVETVFANAEQVVFNAPTLGRTRGFFRITEVPSATADPTPPTIATPSGWPTAATAAGTVTLRATASDNVGVTSLQFVDGVAVLGAGSRVSPTVWEFAWPVTAAMNGLHTITARATDAAGNVGTSGSLAYTINVQTASKTITFDGVEISADSIVTNGLTIQISGNVHAARFAFTADTQITIDLQTRTIAVHGQLELAGVDLPGSVDFVIKPSIERKADAARLEYTKLEWLEFELHNVLLKLDHNSKGGATVDVDATLSLSPLPDLAFKGSLNLSSAPALLSSLDNDLLIAGQPISGFRKGAMVTLTRGSVSVAGALFGGVMDTLGLVTVSGSANVTPIGQLTLSATVSVPTLQSGSFTLRPSAGSMFSATLTSSGLTLAAGGQIDYAGASLGSFQLGPINIAANGDFTVQKSSRPTAPLAVTLLGFLMDNCSFTFTRSAGEMGITSFSGSLRLPSRLGSRRVAVSGSLPANGKFSLTGTTSMDLNFNGFTAELLKSGAATTLSETGLKFYGEINSALFAELGIPPLTLDIGVTPAGVLTYTSDIPVPGLDFGQIHLRPAAGEGALALKLQSDRIRLGQQSKLQYAKSELGNFLIPPITIQPNGDFATEVGTAGTPLTGSLAGFALQNLQFIFARSSGVVSLRDFEATVALGGLTSPVSVRLSGSLESDGHYSLGATTAVDLGFAGLPVNSMRSGADVLLSSGILTATGPLLGGIINSLNLPPLIGTAKFTAAGSVSLAGNVSVPPLVFDSFKIQPPNNATEFLATLSSNGLLIPADAELWYRAQKLGAFGLPAIAIANNGDFSVSVSAANAPSATLRGFNLINVSFTLTRSGGVISVPNFQGDLNNPLLKQHVSGALHGDGTFSVSYTGGITLGAFTLANATINLFQGGLNLHGSPTIPGLPFTLDLDGNVLNDGSFVLTEVFGTQSFFGFPAKNVTYTLGGDATGAGLSVNFGLNFPVGSAAAAFNAALAGSILSDGSFDVHLVRSTFATVLGHQLSNVAMDLKRAESASAAKLSSSADLAVVGILPRIAGEISSSGAFDLVYNGDFALAGFQTISDTINSIHLKETGVTAAGKFALLASVAGNAINFGAVSFSGGLNADATFDLRGSGALNFGPLTTDTFEMALTQSGVYLGAGGSRNLNFGNLKIPFNIFQLTKNGLAQFQGSASGDSGWRRFPSGTPFDGTFTSGDLFGRLQWNVNARASADGNINASLTGTFGAWEAISNPPPGDINNSDIHFAVGPAGISSNGAFTVIQTFHNLTSFVFTLW